MSVYVKCSESYGGGRTHCGDNLGAVSDLRETGSHLTQRLPSETH